MRNPAAEVILAAIGFALCVVVTLTTAFRGNPGWACVFAGCALAYAIAFAVARTELQEERRKVTRPHVPSFPEQRKHDIA